MKPWLRRLKAAVTLGGFWGATAAAVAAACHGVLQLLGGGVSWDLVLQSALLYGVVGWLMGGAFAGTLVNFEARGLLGRMQSWRIGLWGALMGGVLAPLIVVMGAAPSALSGLAAAGLAGLGVAVGSFLSLSTHRLAESASLELAAGAATGRLAAGDGDGPVDDERR